MIESTSVIVFDREQKGLIAEGKKNFWSDGNILNLFCSGSYMGIYNRQDLPN